MWDKIGAYSDASVYLVIAIAGTFLFLTRMVLMLLGGGGHGDLDVSADVHVDAGHGHHADHSDSSSSFNLFSLQSVLAFFMGAGWMGLAARLEWKFGPLPSLALAGGFGLLMMVLSAALTFYMRKLNAEPVCNVQTCLGSTGRVYLTVPARGQGLGQVEVNVDGRRKILPAASAGDEIAAFAVVKVVGIDDARRLVVEPT